jgi:trehalose-phosphatase
VQLLIHGLDLDAFFDQVRRAAHRVLLLDYDGTLAPFNVDRAKAVPYPEVKTIIPSLLRLPNCRTVIVSGRAIADLAKLIGVQPLPEMWGSHGWEHLADGGQYSLGELDEASLVTLRRAGEILDALNIPNLREDKPVSVAAHWRGLSAAQADLVGRYVQDAWGSLVADGALELHPFDGGLELRAKGRNKGSVIIEILSGHAMATGEGNGACGDPQACHRRRGMAGTRPAMTEGARPAVTEWANSVAAAYLGDDLTDEDAFGAMAGKGLRVLVRPTLRDTLADLWLRPPEELVDFLLRWKEACSETRAEE